MSNPREGGAGLTEARGEIVTDAVASRPRSATIRTAVTDSAARARPPFRGVDRAFPTPCRIMSGSYKPFGHPAWISASDHMRRRGGSMNVAIGDRK